MFRKIKDINHWKVQRTLFRPYRVSFAGVRFFFALVSCYYYFLIINTLDNRRENLVFISPSFTNLVIVVILAWPIECRGLGRHVHFFPFFLLFFFCYKSSLVIYGYTKVSQLILYIPLFDLVLCTRSHIHMQVYALHYAFCNKTHTCVGDKDTRYAIEKRERERENFATWLFSLR